jgi:tetratricopeptide (TPR) repeat protein
MQTLILKVSVALMVLTIAAYVFAFDDPQQTKAAMQSMTAAELEKAGDACRAQKDYEQAIVYFKEGLRKDRKNPILYNKLGLAELARGGLKAARSDFAKAAKYDPKYADAWNNMGAVDYVGGRYESAAKYFKKAIAVDETRPLFHVNLGATWFARHQMDPAIREYTRALELDPEALERSSKVGVAAQITNREERAKHDYMLAKIYAKLGNVDSSLACLRKAKEDEYGDLAQVYKDKNFSRMWQDPRLAEIVPRPAPK